MASYADVVFAKIVLKNGLLGEREVREGLEAQAAAEAANEFKDLGEIMLSRGLLREEDARKVYRAQALHQFLRSERIFARIAVMRRVVTEDAVQRAFEEQKASGYRERILEILVREGAMRGPAAESADEAREREMLKAMEREREVFQQEIARLAESDARDQELFGGLSSVNLSSAAVQAINADEMRARVRYPTPVAEMAPGEDDGRPDSRYIYRDAEIAIPAETGFDPLVGQTVANRYKILAKIGEGGMGTVYLAEHNVMEKKCAFKVLRPSLLGSQELVHRFKQEVKAASRFTHKNVVEIYDAGEAEGQICFMAMEFVKGENLEAMIHRLGPTPYERAVRILRQILAAIAEAHKQGIVHRDLKSDNVLVVRGRRGEEFVKVTDFGIAKILQPGQEASLPRFKTQQGMVTGTPQYMSPEQAAGEPIDSRTDIYSIGVILYEMLTGRLPFQAHTSAGYLGAHIHEPPPPFKDVRPDREIPVALERICRKLLAKNRNRRYQTAEDVLRDLDARVMPHLPPVSGAVDDVVVPPLSAIGRLSRAAQSAYGLLEELFLKNPLHLSIAAGAAVIALAVVVTTGLVGRIRRQEREDRVSSAVNQAEEALARDRAYGRARAIVEGERQATGDDPRLLAALARIDGAEEAWKRERAQDERLKELVKAGDRAVLASDLDLARAKYKEAVAARADPEVTAKLRDVDRMAARQQRESDYRAALAAGEQAHARGDIDAAVEAFKRARELIYTEEAVSKLARAQHDRFVQLADRALAQGNLADAIRLYREALAQEGRRDTEDRLEQAKQRHRALLDLAERQRQLEALVKEAHALEERRDFAGALARYRDAQAYAASPEEMQREVRRVAPRVDEQRTFEIAEAARHALEDKDSPRSADYEVAASFYQDYLSRYPEGAFAKEAAERLAALRAAKAKAARE